MQSIRDVLRSRFDKKALKERLHNNPEEVEQAIQLSMKPEQPEGWKAAWVVKNILRPDDPRLVKHLDNIIKTLPDRQDGHQRELLHLLERCSLNEDQEGLVFEICFEIWTSVRKLPTARLSAFQILVGFVSKYPELLHEVKHVTQSEYLETLSPGVKRACQRLLSKIP